MYHRITYYIIHFKTINLGEILFHHYNYSYSITILIAQYTYIYIFHAYLIHLSQILPQIQIICDSPTRRATAEL